MSDLDDVIQITLTRESTPVSTASFQIPMILANFTNFSERTRVYTSIAGVAEDFSSTSSVYIIATRLFGQSTVGAVPPSIVVGRRQVDEVDGTVTVANSTLYSVTINGTAYTYTSDASATALEIVAGLDAAVGALSGITFTDNLDGTFTVGPTVAGTAWSISSSANVTLTIVTPTETWVDALEAVEEDNDTWYELIADTKVVAEQEALSDAIQARRKIYGLSTQDTVAPTTGITDIGYKLEAKSAGRTFGVYLPTANTEYPEAVWSGSQLAYTPGSNDWDFKRGVGATVSKLNATAQANLREKNWNMYISKGGVDVFLDGNMFDGTPIDQVQVA